MDTAQKGAERAQMVVLMGEVPAGRHALDSASLAQGTQETPQQLRRRPQVPWKDVPRELTHSENTSTMDHSLFTKNLQCARWVTAEPLKPLLDNFLFCQVGEHLAQGKIPRDVLETVRMGRMTALQTANCGVRWIVAGDRTIAQQIRGPVEWATSTFQDALQTRAGTECIAHANLAITDAEPRATVLSVDGISAYDTMSRVAILRGLRLMEGGDALLKFVSQFYGSPPRTCGKMTKEGSMRFCRAREANKVAL